MGECDQLAVFHLDTGEELTREQAGLPPVAQRKKANDKSVRVMVADLNPDDEEQVNQVCDEIVAWAKAQWAAKAARK